MKSVLVLVVLMATQAALADRVVLLDGESYTGTVTYMNSGSLEISSSPDSTSKTILAFRIKYVEVATEARRDSLLVFARAADIPIHVVGVAAVIRGADEVVLADKVVLLDGESCTGRVTYMNSDSLKISFPDSTSKTVQTSRIRCVGVVSEARRDSLLSMSSRTLNPSPDRPWVHTELTPIPIVVIGADAVRGLDSGIAGIELKSASTTALWGIGLGTGGGAVAALVALGSPPVGVVIGCGVGVAALVCEIVAWVKVGNAGTELLGLGRRKRVGPSKSSEG